MKNRIVTICTGVITAACMISCEGTDRMKDINTSESEKEAMTSSGIVRLSKIEVYPQYLEEYMRYAVEVGSVSLQNEPGVLTMYAMADKDNPCNITILETYSSNDAYMRHITSNHFRKYKEETLHMVKSLKLDDVSPLNAKSQIINVIKP